MVFKTVLIYALIISNVFGIQLSKNKNSVKNATEQKINNEVKTNSKNKNEMYPFAMNPYYTSPYYNHFAQNMRMRNNIMLRKRMLHNQMMNRMMYPMAIYPRPLYPYNSMIGNPALMKSQNMGMQAQNSVGPVEEENLMVEEEAMAENPVAQEEQLIAEEEAIEEEAMAENSMAEEQLMNEEGAIANEQDMEKDAFVDEERKIFPKENNKNDMRNQGHDSNYIIAEIKDYVNSDNQPTEKTNTGASITTTTTTTRYPINNEKNKTSSNLETEKIGITNAANVPSVPPKIT